MSALLAIVLAGAPLTVSIDSPQKQLFVGEPWKVVVTWTAGAMPISDLALESSSSFERGSLQFQIDDGSGERIYWERYRPGATIEAVSVASPLRAGEKRMQNLVLISGFPFPRAGRYSVRAEHSGWRMGRRVGPTVSSKKVFVHVTEPPDAERQVLAWLSQPRNAWVATAGMGDPEVDELDRLIAENPRSRYLVWPRLRRIRIRSTAAPVDTIGRERRDELRRSDLKALRPVIGEYYAGFLREATSFDGWGIFQEDALALALELAAKARDESEQARIRAELRERFPRSATANQLEHERLAAW